MERVRSLDWILVPIRNSIVAQPAEVAMSLMKKSKKGLLDLVVANTEDLTTSVDKVVEADAESLESRKGHKFTNQTVNDGVAHSNI